MTIHNMIMKNTPPSSSLGLILLGMLTREPMHAYRMQKLIREWGKDKVVNVRRPASVYQTIDRLLRLGLIRIRETVQSESHPDRIVYEITEDGRSTATAWLREMLTAVGSDFPDFPAAVSVLVMLTPRDAQKQLEIRAVAVRNALEKLQAEKQAAGDLPRLFLLEDAYRTALLDAELIWLQATIQDLDTGSLTWNEKWLQDVAEKFTPHDPEAGK
jgi:DNA-binding PadR family transcriptional regulator